MQLIHHGGHNGVTGSCHQLKLDNGKSLLVDCGLFQGEDRKRHPELEIEFSLDGIECFLLTHVHIDHVGRLPYLFAAGFDGPIYCSHPTALLLPIVLEDALKIGFTRNKRLIEKFLGLVQKHLRPLDYETWQDIECGAKVRLSPAGHVAGSAWIEVEAAGKTAVFSGDLGAPNAPLLKDPRPPEHADLLVLESTYGDKTHKGRSDRQAQLEQMIRRSLRDQGTTIIPAFSLGRTQELLYELNGIFEKISQEDGLSLMKRVDVIVDSPMATRFTEIYKTLEPYWDAEAHQLLATDDQPLVFENLTTVNSHSEHMDTVAYLKKTSLPAVVIAGSGMCTGGRVVNYLKEFVGESNTDVLFVGYQGFGTAGRDIQSRRKSVRFDNTEYPVRANVHTISGYSAHADQNDLLNFVRGMKSPPANVRLVHGDRDAKAALELKLDEMQIHCSQPDQ